MRLLLCFLALFVFQWTIAGTPSGICSVYKVAEKNRHVMDRSKHAWVFERFNETVRQEVCCSGYAVERQTPLKCSPICDPECSNSLCMAPDTCVCLPGLVMINNSSNTCYDVCDSCVNGKCLSPLDTECTCDLGFQRDPTFPHICNPICNPDCENASCTAPSVCECYEGYKPSSNTTFSHICVPRCEEDCVFGICSEPDVCTCFKGYINDKDSPSICLPVCNNTCHNGDCYAPDMCKCRHGFVLHPRNPYLCIPEDPEDSSLKSCELTMSNAIRYDKDSDCFSLKEKISLSVSSDCRVIESTSGSFCSEPDTCQRSECVLNFRCSASKFEGSNGIICFLEKDVFETDSTDINQIINVTEWTDVVLVVNSYYNFNTSREIKENLTKQWTLQPLSKGPVCGSMHFAVEMSECQTPNTTSTESRHIISSSMFWINVFLICCCLLLVGGGAGGFLWARHRTLNDPFNYREDMIRGYYNNECYENHPTELVSDDDSDHNSDAPQ